MADINPAEAPRKEQDGPGDAANGKPDAGTNDRKDKAEEGKQKQQQPARWPWYAAGVVLAGFVAVVLIRIYAPQPDVWTDDAYVEVHYALVAPRIAGQVNAVLVNDNQVVKAGQVLVTLDPRDNQASLDLARAAMQRDQAQVGDVGANIARQPALIAEQEAQLSSAQARFRFAQMDQRRYVKLAETGAGTQQRHQQADATLQESEAAVQQAAAALDASRRQMDVLRQQQSSAEATLQSDRARLEQAKLNLSYTRVVAPVDGMVGERSVEVGNIVSPGAVMMSVVPLSQVYVTANYREVDLRHVRPGQHVTIHVDAYNIDLDGVVNSIAPASGAAFSPIPPNNATGNFTKIVQRLPVKVEVSAGQPLAKLLRVGFSVETTIHTGLADVVGAQRDTPDRVTAQ